MMKPNVRATCATALLLSLSPLLASAEPVPYGDGKGNVFAYYEVVLAPAILWGDANDAANAKSIPYKNKLIQGHLATLTSKEEDDFVENLGATAPGLSGDRTELWVGGFQSPTDCPAPPASGWQWVNDEGPIGGDAGPGAYTNWHAGEPNDAGGCEQNLAIGRFLPDLGWNDEGSAIDTRIAGYVVEYDVPVDATTCATAEGCAITKDEHLTLPPNITNPGDVIGVTTYTFADDPGRCGNNPLPLFFNSNKIPALVIPSYLCATAKDPNEPAYFIVVKTKGQGFDIPSGTVGVEDNFLDGNAADKCDKPVTVDPDPDPIFERQVTVRQAVVVWQAADASEMHETRLEAPGLLGVSRLLTGVPVPQVVLPGAGEFTDGCGSSLGSVRNGSYHVIGMHIGFKDGVAVLDGYTALTSYKLQLLQMAIESAKNDNAITKAQYNQLSAHSNDAAKHFGQGLYGPTLNDLQHLDDTIHKISIVPQPFNHEGDMEMRTLNLIFTIQNKVVPLSK